MKKNTMEKQPLPDFIKEDAFFSTYPSNKMTIFVTKGPTHILKGEYSHLNYEFIIARSHVQNFVINGTKVDLEPNTLVAINSQQKHGTQFLLSGVSTMNIQFEKEFLQELAYGIYGVREIVFDNTPVLCDGELSELTEKYIFEHEQKKEGYCFVLDNLSVQIAVKIFRKTCVANHIDTKAIDQQISKTIEHFKHNYSEEFSFDEISKVSNMSKFNLIRKFKESTGMTPYDYYMDIRIMKALEYLNNPNNKIIDVAIMCGFKTHSHFSKIFKTKTGLTPNEYRMKGLGM